MKHLTIALGLLAVLLGAAQAAHALDYVSVDSSSAILYETDSLKSRKLYVVSRYMPLERVIDSANWVKVRDRAGSMAWVEKRVLSSKRYVVVTTERASVRQAPDAGAAVVFQVVQNVALEWLGAAGGGWSKVRHQDGATGYIRSTEVWGDE
jgi:SH3 domain protein